MRQLEMKTKVNVIHTQKKVMLDKETKKEVVYYEVSILAPSIFEGVEKATSGQEFKTGEQAVKLLFKPSANEIKLKISSQTETVAQK